MHPLGVVDEARRDATLLQPFGRAVAEDERAQAGRVGRHRRRPEGARGDPRAGRGPGSAWIQDVVPVPSAPDPPSGRDGRRGQPALGEDDIDGLPLRRLLV